MVYMDKGFKPGLWHINLTFKEVLITEISVWRLSVFSSWWQVSLFISWQEI
jgi:hypothetical protein